MLSSNQKFSFNRLEKDNKHDWLAVAGQIILPGTLFPSTVGHIPIEPSHTVKTTYKSLDLYIRNYFSLQFETGFYFEKFSQTLNTEFNRTSSTSLGKMKINPAGNETIDM